MVSIETIFLTQYIVFRAHAQFAGVELKLTTKFQGNNVFLVALSVITVNCKTLTEPIIIINNFIQFTALA